MSAPMRRDALIHDLAIVLAGSLHPDAQIGPAPRLAARRLRDVLGITDGERAAVIESMISKALAAKRIYTHDADGAIIAVDSTEEQK